jgi:hypothetical protein
MDKIWEQWRIFYTKNFMCFYERLNDNSINISSLNVSNKHTHTHIYIYIYIYKPNNIILLLEN